MLIFKLVIILVFAILVRQLWLLQIVQGDEFRRRADNNRFRLMSIEAQRGVVYDRNRILLVRNTPSYTVSIIPADLPAKPGVLYERLAGILKMDVEEISRRVELPPRGRRTTDAFTPVPIKTNVSWETAFVAEERHLDLPGVYVQVQPMREYLDGQLTSQILGYVAPISKEQYDRLKDDPRKKYGFSDRIGQTGIEATYEPYLRGEPGERHMSVDSTGREVETLLVEAPRHGNNLRLTIDISLQREIARILEPDLDKLGGSATAVAMDPRNGQILAMMSLPSYDNNLFSKGISSSQLAALMNDKKRPLINHAISAVAAPGSSFKIVTASGALQEGVIGKWTQIFDPGYILIPNPFNPSQPSRMVCWAPHGNQDMISALANSCDVYFYHLGGGPPNGEWRGLGADRLEKYAKLFGFGAPTGVELPGEAAGNVPNESWKKLTVGDPWYKGDTYNFSIGQGFVTATPLQLLNATAVVANGGTLYRPQLLLEITDSEGKVVKPFRPEVIRDVPVERAYLDIVKEGLRAGMLVGRTEGGTDYVGTSYDSEVPGLRIAGKTGTAQFGVPDEKGDMPTHGWFAAFAPVDNAEIAVVVFIEKGGGKDAAKVVSNIMRYYFRVPENQAAR
ncbi:MAG: penicillin-binding protein 2 [Chloroflexi bacterium]|nr:penicillin-binding protein 2 [Chloroflexota bacterium]